MTYLDHAATTPMLPEAVAAMTALGLMAQASSPAGNLWFTLLEDRACDVGLSRSPADALTQASTVCGSSPSSAGVSLPHSTTWRRGLRTTASRSRLPMRATSS